MADLPLDLAAIAAYQAFALSSADRLGEMPPWAALPPEARADWRAVADAAQMAAQPSAIVHVTTGMDDADLAALREKLAAALASGKPPTILPPGPRPGTWEITVDGGGAFARNAAYACRNASHSWGAGPMRDALTRLAAALDTATYGGDPEGDPS